MTSLVSEVMLALAASQETKQEKQTSIVIGIILIVWLKNINNFTYCKCKQMKSSQHLRIIQRWILETLVGGAKGRGGKKFQGSIHQEEKNGALVHKVYLFI